MNVSRSELGELTGFILIGLFILLGFRYVLKAYFKINAKKLDKNSQFYKILVKVMSLNKTLHPYVGYTAILFIALHSFIQTGWNLYFDSETITGIITGLLFVFNVIDGFVGENMFKTKRPKWWIWVHCSLTILIGISILIHINQ